MIEETIIKILIADKVAPNMITDLEHLGASVASKPDVTADELPQEIADAQVLIVRSKKVTAQTIAAGRNLSLIVRAGAGVNTIDLDAASKAGTYVANCPGKNTAAVAELAIGLLIACDRNIADATEALRQGAWQKKRFGKARGLKGRTLGIVGTGAIGLAVARRAQALDMRVMAWSRSLTPEKAKQVGVEHATSLAQLAQAADAISVHIASTPETKNLIQADFFSHMKANAIFVNTSRGNVVDYPALLDAITTKGIKAGLDVFADEPAGGEASFEQTELASRVVCTPHIGASTDQSEEAIADETVRIVKVFSEAGTPPNVVNLRASKQAGATLIIRHYNRVGVLSGVLAQLRDQDINIEEMQNQIFAHAAAACCSMTIDTRPDQTVLDKIAENLDIIELRCAGPGEST